MELGLKFEREKNTAEAENIKLQDSLNISRETAEEMRELSDRALAQLGEQRENNEMHHSYSRDKR